MSIQRTPAILQDLRRGNLSLFDYLEALERRFLQLEPTVLAFVPEENRFDRLREEGDALLKAFPHPDDRPPLFGLPMGVKDIFHIDGFPTRAGSKIPPETLSGNEAACVTQMKRLGALVFGKCVTTEFAYFAPGPTRNPHNPSHTPGGSSSGSAAAVAAGIVPFAFGTQTIGSINRPASYCGVVGFKPTYDRISKSGVIPLAPSVDHVGFFTPDTATALHIAPFLVHQWSPPGACQKPTLGVPLGPYLEHAEGEMAHHFAGVCLNLEAAGYLVKRIAVMEDFEDIAQRHKQLVAVEAARTHETWYAEFGPLYHPKTVALIEQGQKVSPQDYTQALEGRHRLAEELTSTMDNAGIDLWLSPAATGAAPQGLESTGDPVMNLPWTHAGFPTLTIPSGVNEAGLPVGIQIAAHRMDDERMLRWATGIASHL